MKSKYMEYLYKTQQIIRKQTVFKFGHYIDIISDLSEKFHSFPFYFTYLAKRESCEKKGGTTALCFMFSDR